MLLPKGLQCLHRDDSHNVRIACSHFGNKTGLTHSARLGSLTAASDELHTVQLNVTARIRALEDELGIPLFRRHSRGVVLTPAGERLLPYANKIAQLLKEAGNAAGDSETPCGRL